MDNDEKVGDKIRTGMLNRPSKRHLLQCVGFIVLRDFGVSLRRTLAMSLLQSLTGNSLSVAILLFCMAACFFEFPDELVEVSLG